MPSSNPRRQKPTSLCLPTPLEREGMAWLHGDLQSLKDAFTGRAKKTVTCPMTDTLRLKLDKHTHGISGFIEEAVASFDGDLPALVRAAVIFCDNRSGRMPDDPISNVSARLLPETFAKIEAITAALKAVPVRGSSRAKVIAGLIQILLSQQT